MYLYYNILIVGVFVDILADSAHPVTIYLSYSVKSAFWKKEQSQKLLSKAKYLDYLQAVSQKSKCLFEELEREKAKKKEDSKLEPHERQPTLANITSTVKFSAKSFVDEEPSFKRILDENSKRYILF